MVLLLFERTKNKPWTIPFGTVFFILAYQSNNGSIRHHRKPLQRSPKAKKASRIVARTSFNFQHSAVYNLGIVCASHAYNGNFPHSFQSQDPSISLSVPRPIVGMILADNMRCTKHSLKAVGSLVEPLHS